MLIVLLQPHEHAGQTHPAGAVLDLPEAAARWCLAVGVAQRAPKAPSRQGKPALPATDHKEQGQ